MALYPIRTFGDPVLRTVTAQVDDISSAYERLVDDMIETMYDAPGVGLAAPQIGISKAIFVADIGEGPFTMFNPVVVSHRPESDDDLDAVRSDSSGDAGDAIEEWTYDEGCLSVPGRYWSITRPAFARARGYDIDGNVIESSGDELMGRVLQHEIDHLNGMLLLERLPKRVRKTALKELRRETLGFGDLL